MKRNELILRYKCLLREYKYLIEEAIRTRDDNILDRLEKVERELKRLRRLLKVKK